MKTVVFMTFLMMASIGCNGQENRKKYSYHKGDTTIENQPRISWKVNKEIDSNGNIIRYDSTYVWSYTNKGTHEQVKVDSVMNLFKSRFDTQFRNLFRQNFGTPVWNDSLFYRKFTDPGYFMHKWKNNELDIDNFISQMDSTRNAFLKDYFPGLEASEKKNK
ncbi:hypothetical protein [Chitinophaga sp. OAE865]|uniref:hypothetical protein n=1 Tax=Chitinophaga sp. OAE865 TaxID=2817898 RepID=UPI001AE103E3